MRVIKPSEELNGNETPFPQPMLRAIFRLPYTQGRGLHAGRRLAWVEWK